ncbi:MAG: YgiT-type zinc finger protein [Candidatus Hydrogenedentes bacterium]|nr:YgiT-type zinc finger protein [Candidatus Hydrogenedentota bacterium]
MDVRTCPTCGSTKIKTIRGTITREYDGEKYSVSNVEYHECPDCGEKIYGREAVPEGCPWHLEAIS